MNCNFTYNNEEAVENADSRGEAVGAGREMTPVQPGMSVPVPNMPDMPNMSDIPDNGEFDENTLFGQVELPVSAQRPAPVSGGKKEPLPCIEPLSVAAKTAEAEIYTQGYLKSHVSKKVNIFSLVGSELKENNGTLKKVGANFLVLEDGGAEQVLCDLSSIKFVQIII